MNITTTSFAPLLERFFTQPDPAKRYQIEKHKQWASLQVDYATMEGLRPEAERMKQLVRDCDNELAEMDLIESYQRDERREVSIRIEPAGRRSALAERKSIRSQAKADSRSCEKSCRLSG